MKYVSKRLLIAAAAGFTIGVFWLVAVRFITIQKDEVHYHANFALYINGQREEFDNFTFYEEVQACGGDAINNPRTRVHMHDQINNVAHVHGNAATWGHFFANLDYGLTNQVIQTDDGVFVDDEDGQLEFILNGETVRGVANTTIRSGDVLLINYGEADEQTLMERYEAIERSAEEYNQRQDPSSCSGGKPLTFSERLRQAIGIF